jgi:hypothetical protein
MKARRPILAISSAEVLWLEGESNLNVPGKTGRRIVRLFIV